MPRDIRVILVLEVITVVATAFRLYHLDWQCLATDENYTIHAANLSSIYSVVLWSLGSDYNPPLYYVAAHISSAFFGGVTWYSIRFPAMIFGVLCVPAMYLLGREMRGDTLGLLMAVVASFLFPYVYYSQNARAYTLVMLAFIGFVIMFIRIYRGDIRYRTIIVLTAFAILCFWSHFYSIFPIAAAMVILSVKYQKVLVVTGTVTALLCIPFIRYIPVAINHFSKLNAAQHSQFWFTPLQIAVMMPNELFCWSWLVIIPLAIVSASKTPLYRNLFIISTVTILTCIVPMTAITAVSPRYALLVSPVLLLLAMDPISDIIERQTDFEKKVSLFMAAVFGLFLFNYGSLVSWYTFSICPYV